MARASDAIDGINFPYKSMDFFSTVIFISPNIILAFTRDPMPIGHRARALLPRRLEAFNQAPQRAATHRPGLHGKIKGKVGYILQPLAANHNTQHRLAALGIFRSAYRGQK